MTGRVVGNYKILEKIGAGGMGVVYRGLDLMLERDVAIKVLHQEKMHQANVVDRFRAEAVTLARISHPNVATLYSFLYQDEHYFMVMEFVPGNAFEDLIRRSGAMSLERALPLFMQALEGIEQAHRLGIVHRDIKPANLMVTHSGVVKVMDFGIARVLGQNRFTRTGHLIGTLEYMSPEQIRGQEVDTRSDIYSLGILLYEMLTGCVPFDGGSDFELMQAQIEQVPWSLRSKVPTIPESVDKAVLRALEKSPSARFQHVAAFQEALQRHLRSAAPTRTTIKGQKPTRVASQPEEQTKPIVALPFKLPGFSLNVSAFSRKLAALRLQLPKARLQLPASMADTLAQWSWAGRSPAQWVQQPYVMPGLVILVAVLLLVFFWPSMPTTHTETTRETDAAQDTTDTVLFGAAGPAFRPSTEAVAPEQFPIKTEVPVVPEVVVEPRPQEASATATLLQKAQDYFEKNWLTTPPGDNTVAVCLEILRLAPGHPEAVALLRRVVQRYLALGDAQMKKGTYDKAQGYYATGLEVAKQIPGNPTSLMSETEKKLAEANTYLQVQPENPRLGSIRIVVRPFGDIYINGSRKARESIQPYHDDLAPGTYRIRAAHPTLGTWEKQVVIEAGVVQELLFNFAQEYRLTITSEPLHAEIYIDGKATGRTTPASLALHPGQHTIEVRKKGYQDTTGAKQITLERTLSEPIHFVLHTP